MKTKILLFLFGLFFVNSFVSAFDEPFTDIVLRRQGGTRPSEDPNAPDLKSIKAVMEDGFIIITIDKPVNEPYLSMLNKSTNVELDYPQFTDIDVINLSLFGIAPGEYLLKLNLDGQLFEADITIP